MTDRVLVLCKPFRGSAYPYVTLSNLMARIALVEPDVRLLSMRTVRFTPEAVSDFYAHVKHLPMFLAMQKFYCSTDVFALVFEGEDIYRRMRDVATFIRTWHPSGGVSFDNALHVSDDAEAFEREKGILETL